MGFYPHGKPGFYAYTRHFVDDFGGKTAHLAEVHTIYPGLDSGDGKSVVVKALWNLQTLINGARAAEMAFLKDTGIDLTEGGTASEVYRNINLILNSKDTFNRGMRFLEQLATGEDKNSTYRDISKNFSSYLDGAIAQRLKNINAASIVQMNADQIKKLINDIIGNALKTAYTNAKDFIDSEGNIRAKNGKNAKRREDEEAIQAINDMIDVIDRLKQNGAFKEFGDLFKLDKNSLALRKNNQITFKQRVGNIYNNAEVKSYYDGNALEVITSTVAAELGNINITTHSPGGDLHIVGRHTGNANKMKADTLLFVGRGTINPDDYIDYVDYNTFGNRTRMQNVDALGRYINNLENNIQHVIAISDKNYSITANFDGIHAQEKMNLQNVGLLLGQFGVDHITELVTYLANCGDLMVQGKVAAEVRTELQSLIGYFLFDNLQVDIKGSGVGPNVVNLMNVSGLYIPLSVYLEGIYNSIQDAMSNPSSLVSVSISLGGPTQQSVWTPENWGDFREERETQSFISYKILKGIASFISNL